MILDTKGASQRDMISCETRASEEENWRKYPGNFRGVTLRAQLARSYDFVVVARVAKMKRARSRLGGQ